jgi:chitin disaccharide deacetylase
VASLAARLGFSDDDRVVLLHVDDVGLCHAQNLGFFDVVEYGLVTTGSVMVPCPWFPEAAAYARRRPELDLGVHLCLNSEFETLRWRPLVGPDRAPSLVDGDGFFWASPSETLAHADPHEVRLELRAQVDRAIASGIDVTHLDAHMGTAMMPELLPIYLDLGREYSLPVFLPRPTPQLLEELGHPEIVPELPDILAALEESRVIMVDHAELRSLSFPVDEAEEHFRRAVAELRRGVTHFVLHPARADEELEAATPDSAGQREAERRVFCTAAASRWLDEGAVRRIGYRRIRELLRD